MMENQTNNTSEAQLRLQQVVDYLRSNIRQLDDPRAQALYETSAEVLLGLKKAFMDYSKQRESAWR